MEHKLQMGDYYNNYKGKISTKPLITYSGSVSTSPPIKLGYLIVKKLYRR